MFFDKVSQSYRLYIYGRINQAMFLNRILPHLIVKRDKAEECLEWLKNCSEKGKLHITEKRKIRELRNLGLNGNQIAKEIGRNRSTIYSYYEKENLLN